MSSDPGAVLSPPSRSGRRRWVAPVSYGMLGLELAVVVGFAATYNALDFRIYMWGGHAVTHDTRLYLTLAYGHWFTYSPFAAVVFVPIAAIPLAIARVLWDLASVAALVYSVVLVLKLAGYRPTPIMVAGVTAAAMALDPVYQTLFLGQINLILLALILTDVWRVSRGQNAGLGVGVAAAVKLTPAIFIVFFLLAGRTKTALMAAGTFVGCGLIGLLIAPRASKLYWEHLFYDTKRVGAPYISNQSPYAAAIRIAGGAAHVGAWYVVIPLALAAVGLAAAAVLARGDDPPRPPREGIARGDGPPRPPREGIARGDDPPRPPREGIARGDDPPRPPREGIARHGDWLAAAAVTGVTGLLVSPISWAHHWVWILPALVVLVRDGHRVTAGLGYLLFAVAPFWYTPGSGGPSEYGFHWLLTLAANCYLIAGLAFLAYAARRAYLVRAARRPEAPGQEPRLASVPTDASRGGRR